MASSTNYPDEPRDIQIRLDDGSILVAESTTAPLSADCRKPNTVPIICFHGSGPNPVAPWTNLISQLTGHYRIILFERPQHISDPARHVSLLRQYLYSSTIPGPFILLAHSYGGLFAKHFLLQYPADVAGILLVETGKAPEPTDRRWKGGKSVLGSTPLSVISGNSLIHKRRQITPAGHTATADQLKYFEEAEQQDVALEKAQLQMSRNAKYVHLRDCGHDVIRDRADVVAGEVKLLVEQLARDERDGRPIWKQWLAKLFSTGP